MLSAGQGLRFVGCEKDSGCVEKSILWIAELNACQLRNDKSDLKCREELMQAAWVFLSGFKFLDGTRL